MPFPSPPSASGPLQSFGPGRRAEPGIRQDREQVRPSDFVPFGFQCLARVRKRSVLIQVFRCRVERSVGGDCPCDARLGVDCQTRVKILDFLEMHRRHVRATGLEEFLQPPGSEGFEFFPGMRMKHHDAMKVCIRAGFALVDPSRRPGPRQRRRRYPRPPPRRQHPPCADGRVANGEGSARRTPSAARCRPRRPE